MTYQEAYDLYLRPYLEDKAMQDRIEAGIEQNRKGNCRVRVLDGEGKPITGTRVEIKQISHDFRYGANMLMLDEFGDESLNVAYRDSFSQYFNLATVPFYWNTLEPERGKPRYAADSEKVYRRPAPDLCFDYCREKGIDAKLHCLVYEAFVPEWLQGLPLEEVKKAYEQRFAEISARYADKLYEVEVINEVICSPKWKKYSALLSSPDLLPWCFQTARKYFPRNTLVFNEASRWHRIGKDKQYDAYPLLLQNAMLKGASFDKIGIQSHLFVGRAARTPEAYDESVRTLASHGDVGSMLASLDVLAAFNLPLEITEITIPTFGEGEDFEQLQADMLRLWYAAYFSHPAVNTVVYWNTADGHCYAPSPENDENRCRGGLFHNDMTPKKSALMLKRLFDEEWRTNLSLTTDENGYLSFRGFFGSYTANVGGRCADFTLESSKQGELVLVIK